MTLDDAIATLYAREINCGCETFSRENMRQAGQWLVDEATRLYPKAFQ